MTSRDDIYEESTLRSAELARRTARPTMNDVAAAAGVGLKSVSRVVNGEKVRPETERSVLAAIEALGFRRNAGAAQLRQGSTASVGLVVGDLSEPFQSAVAHAVESVTMAQGSVLMAASSADDPDRERVVVEAFLARRVDGLIIIPMSHSHDYLEPDVRAGLRVVFVDRPATDLASDTVLSDNVRGCMEGVAHLIAHGHRRIGYFGDRPVAFTALERRAGYEMALRGAGLDVDERLVEMSEPDPELVARALRRMFTGPDPATAVMTANSRLTFAVLREQRRAGRSSAVVGFDDFELADLIDPAVTVVAQDPASIGRTAADLLFRRLAGDDGPPQRIHLATRLVARGSGEVPPAR